MKRLVAIALLLVSSTAIADWTLLGTGTAVVVNKDYALTAAHVLEECDAATIRHKHKEFETDIAAVDSTNDLGLLLLKESFEQTAKFRDGKSVRKGDTVVNYGYPLFGELSDAAKISKGVINALAGWGNDSRHIQYDAPTQPGNSGGPVLDLSGNVVGIVSSGLSQRYAEETGHIAQNVNFAVKSYVAEGFLSSNGVDYEQAESVEKMELADIGEKAETFTVLVGCWEGFAEPEQATPEESIPDKDTKPEQTTPDQENGPEQPAPTKPDESVRIEKSESDTCPDGTVQTYKGCQEISTAEAEATKAAARAKAMAEANARAALAQSRAAAETDTGTGTGTGTDTGTDSVWVAECKAALAVYKAAKAVMQQAWADVKACWRVSSWADCEHLNDAHDTAEDADWAAFYVFQAASNNYRCKK